MFANSKVVAQVTAKIVRRFNRSCTCFFDVMSTVRIALKRLAGLRNTELRPVTSPGPLVVLLFNKTSGAKLAYSAVLVVPLFRSMMALAMHEAKSKNTCPIKNLNHSVVHRSLWFMWQRLCIIFPSIFRWYGNYFIGCLLLGTWHWQNSGGGIALVDINLLYFTRALAMNYCIVGLCASHMLMQMFLLLDGDRRSPGMWSEMRKVMPKLKSTSRWQSWNWKCKKINYSVFALHRLQCKLIPAICHVHWLLLSYPTDVTVLYIGWMEHTSLRKKQCSSSVAAP